MGFIENLRRKIADEKVQNERNQQFLVEQQKLKAIEEEQKVQAERKRFAEDKRRSEEFMSQSYFPTLVSELTSLLERARVRNIGSHHYGDGADDWKASPPSSNIVLDWGSRVVRAGRYWGTWERKSLSIECFSDGTIQVRGRRKQTLKLDKWKNNPGIQEKALEKAFLNPAKFRHTERSEPENLGRGI